MERQSRKRYNRMGLSYRFWYWLPSGQRWVTASLRSAVYYTRAGFPFCIEWYKEKQNVKVE